MAKLGKAGEGAWPASLGLLLSMAVAACNPLGTGAGPGGGGSSNPRCVTYCGARQTKGCGGDESLCRLACNTDYTVAASQGSCTQAYTDLSDCQNDPAILELGCSPSVSKTDEFCKTPSDAYEACAKKRDGT